MHRKNFGIVFVLSLLFCVSSCGENTNFGKDCEINDIKSKFTIASRKVVEATGKVEMFSSVNADNKSVVEFKTQYYQNALVKKETTNKNISSDTLSVVKRVSGVATTTTYDYISKSYTEVVGSVSFIPVFTSLLNKVNSYSEAAYSHRLDSKSFTCKEKKLEVDYSQNPITLDVETKLKLRSICLTMDDEQLVGVKYATQLSNIITSYEVSYSYGTLAEFDLSTLKIDSSWKAN